VRRRCSHLLHQLAVVAPVHSRPGCEETLFTPPSPARSCRASRSRSPCSPCSRASRCWSTAGLEGDPPPLAISRNLPQSPAISHNLPQPPATSRDLPRPPATSRNLPRPPAISRNLPQSPTIFRDLPQSCAISRNLPRPPTKSSAIFRDLPQRASAPLSLMSLDRRQTLFNTKKARWTPETRFCWRRELASRGGAPEARWHLWVCVWRLQNGREFVFIQLVSDAE